MVTGETVKAHISWLNESITRIYRDIYGETIRKGWNKRTPRGDLRLYPQKNFQSPDGELRYDMELERDVDILVTLKCDPRVNESTIMNLYKDGFMTKQKAIDQLESITGLPKGILQVVPDEKLDFYQMGGKTKKEKIAGKPMDDEMEEEEEEVKEKKKPTPKSKNELKK